MFVNERQRSGFTRQLANRAAFALIVAALPCYVSYRLDCNHLRKTAEPIAADSSTSEARVLDLLHWVHNIPQSAENQHYFVLPRLRATPMQVLTSGGDCADKSRLLSSMLRQIGIPATMLMCFDPQTRTPTHTVVCALLGPGRTMIVDPAYDLCFPRRDGGYYGLGELRDDPSILATRLAEMRSNVTRWHPVHAYNAASAHYGLAASVNWNKNSVMRAVHEVIHPMLGDELYSWPRPIALEEPKLFIALLSATGAMLALLLPRAWSLAAQWLVRRAPAYKATTPFATAT